MPRIENESLRTLYVGLVLLEHTSEREPLSAEGIANKVNELSKMTLASRKSVVRDIEAYKKFLNINTVMKNRAKCYYIFGRRLSISELMFLFAAIRDSHFISESQSKRLREHLSIHASEEDLRSINNALQPESVPKSVNPASLANTELIVEAINRKCKIRFLFKKFYFDKGGFAIGNDGDPIDFTPIALQYSRAECYVIGWWDDVEWFRTFRLDRIYEVQVLVDVPATDNEEIRGFDQGKFYSETFGMYSSNMPAIRVKFKIGQNAANAFLEAFDYDPRRLANSYEDGFGTAYAYVQTSPSFYSWVSCFGDQLQIDSPEQVRDEYRAFLENALNPMKENK